VIEGMSPMVSAGLALGTRPGWEGGREGGRERHTAQKVLTKQVGQGPSETIFKKS